MENVYGLIIIICTAIAAALFYKFEVKKKKTEGPPPLPEVPKPQRTAAHDALLAQAQAHGDTTTADSIMAMTYEGKLPVRLPNGEWEDMYAKKMTFSIAGINFRKGIKKYLGEDEVRLVADPKNEFDPNAIKIVNSDNAHLGFVPRTDIDAVLEFVGKLPAYGFVEIYEDYGYSDTGDDDDDDPRTYYVGIVTLYK